MAWYDPTVLGFAIMAEVGGDLRGWLTARLAAAGYRLDEDGGLRAATGDDLGLAWSLAAGDDLAARPWHVASSGCPFVGPLAGYLRLTPAAGAGAPPAAVVEALARLGRGVVARLDDDRARAAVALRAVAIEDATAPDGLDRGALLLDRESGAYAADVLGRIKAAAAAAGLRIGLTWQPDGERRDRNPVVLQRVQPIGSDQAYPPIWLRGGGSIDPLRPLRGLTVELWLDDVEACVAALVSP